MKVLLAIGMPNQFEARNTRKHVAHLLYGKEELA